MLAQFQEPVVARQPTAARTGVWSIRPAQALRWASVYRPLAPTTASVDDHRVTVVRMVGLTALVLLAALLGGVGAWLLTP